MKNQCRKFSSALIALAGITLVAVSANAQLTITNGLTLWLKADAITGLTNGQSVAAWNDSSTNGNNVTQATAAQQPVYLTGVQHGLPVVRFSGPSPGSGFDIGNQLITAGSLPTLTNMSVFLVAKSADALNRYALSFGNNNYAVIQGFNDSLWEWFDTPRTSLGSIDTTKFQAVSFTGANTTNQAPWTIGSDTEFGGFHDTNPFNGDMAEVLVFNRSLSATERQDVTEYLVAKWAIPEPSTVGLLGIGALVLLRLRRS